MSGGYEHHPSFERPEPDERIWRYLDFAKLVDLLDRRALHFARADTMLDPWEGALSPSMEDAHGEVFAQEVAELGGEAKLERQAAVIAEIQNDYRRHWREFRSRVFMSCWYRADHESAAMWDLYSGRDGRGVAIQSTFERLERALPPAYPYAIYAGKVRYIDYRSEVIPLGNAFNRFLHKRRSFEHEQEVRAMFDTHGAQTQDQGFNVSVDVDGLIEQVHVAPTAPAWFAELVVRTVRRHDLAAGAIQSDLYRGPVD